MNGILIGVDLGGTTIKIAVSDTSGNWLLTSSLQTESHGGPNHVLERMVSRIRELVDKVGGQHQGVGLGVPGLIDLASGTTKFLPNLPTQWRDVPVVALLEEQLGCPVRMLNDVRTATLGELRFGHGREVPKLTMVFFSIGTGIGGGIALKGDLWLGPMGAAGEIGHQTILADGPRCGCGNRGCLEAIASGPAISAYGVRLMHSGLAPSLYARVHGQEGRVTPREMAAVVDQDPLVKEAIIDAARAIGIAASNVVTILHPDLVVLGGGVAEIGPLLSDTVRQVIDERVRMFPTDSLRVERSLLGDTAGLHGAIALAMAAATSKQ